MVVIADDGGQVADAGQRREAGEAVEAERGGLGQDPGGSIDGGAQHHGADAGAEHAERPAARLQLRDGGRGGLAGERHDGDQVVGRQRVRLQQHVVVGEAPPLRVRPYRLAERLLGADDGAAVV